MGKLLISAKYIFLIYSADVSELRKHIHVTYSHRGFKKSCKFWLEPNIELVESNKGDFSALELKEIETMIHKNKNLLLVQLEKFHNLEKVNAIQI